MSYREQVDLLRKQLSEARGALARDLATAVAAADWQAFLRDRYDVNALVAHIDGLAAKPEWVAKLQAAGDRARQQGRQRGRPRTRQQPATASKPVAATKPSAVVANAAG